MNLNIRNMVIWPVPSVRSDSEGTVRRNTSRKTSILRQTQAPISLKLQYPPRANPGHLTNTLVSQGSGEFDQLFLNYPEKHTEE